MATPKTWRPRTIQFYELLLEPKGGGERVRTEQQDWQGILGHLARADLASRTWDGADRPILAQVYPVEEVDRLILHKLRGAGDWLAEVDFATEQISEVEAQAGRGYLDSTAIHFVEFGNIVAMIAGSTAAPSHKALEGYLNHLDPFGTEDRIIVSPVMSQAEMEKLQQASEVGRFEIKVGTSQLSALKGRDSSLARWLRRSTQFGDVNLTVIISVPRGKKHSSQRQDLAGQLMDISDVIPGAAAAARATLYYGPEDALSAGRITELVEHHITVKRNVPAVDEHGNSIKFSSAFQVIEMVLVEHESELRAATDA